MRNSLCSGLFLEITIKLNSICQLCEPVHITKKYNLFKLILDKRKDNSNINHLFIF